MRSFHHHCSLEYCTCPHNLKLAVAVARLAAGVTASLVPLIHAEALGGAGGVNVRVAERTRIVALLEIRSTVQGYMSFNDERLKMVSWYVTVNMKAIVSCCCRGKEPRTELAVASSFQNVQSIGLY